MCTLSNVKTRRGETDPRSVGFTSDALPEAISSKTGVSVRYVETPEKKWYVFRASYGRENQASDYFVDDGTYTYIAKKYVEKYVKGKRKRYLKNLISNILFAYTTEEKAYAYVQQTPELSWLSFYYNHFETDAHQKNPPLTISCAEMRQFILATCSKNKHLLFVDTSHCHFKSGDMVRVVDGPFLGVEGRVARVSGQQRVVISLSGIGLISTAYIPTAFIQKISNDDVR
jgi:transcription antitermination factor NusG